MRWIGVAAAVAVLAFVAAGCGSSSDSSSEAAGDTAVTETSSSTSTSSSTGETSTETTSSETTATDASGDLAGLTGDCKDLAEAGQKFGAAIASSASGGNGDLAVTANAFKEFAAQAPDELKDDFEVLAHVFVVYAAALKGIDLKAGSTPTAAQIAKLTKLGQSFNSAEVQKASTDIAAWGKAHCGATP
jgi:hypothetical protein